MKTVRWNAWKAITIGIAVVATTALITGMMVANLNGKEEPKAAAVSQSPARAAAAAPAAHRASTGSAGPTRSDGLGNVAEKALIGGALGAGVGAASGAIPGGGKGGGKGAVIGGIVGATAGTLLGLHEK